MIPGELFIKDGVVVGLGDRSSHYPQTLEHTEQAVLALADNPGERERVGAAARAYIERERRWRNNAEQLLSLLPGPG